MNTNLVETLYDYIDMLEYSVYEHVTALCRYEDIGHQAWVTQEQFIIMEKEHTIRFLRSQLKRYDPISFHRHSYGDAYPVVVHFTTADGENVYRVVDGYACRACGYSDFVVDDIPVEYRDDAVVVMVFD